MNHGSDNTADTVSRLREGGVLLLATDTLPGLHCRADDPAAVARLNRLKGRPATKPLLVLAGSLAQALAVTTGLDDDQLAVCRRCWPGPFSLILPAALGLRGPVTGGGNTIAVRVPALTELRDLILAVGVPLVSSSANLAGQEPARDLTAVAGDLVAGIDGVWGRAVAQAPGLLPSALVDLTVTPPVVLRRGPVDFPSLFS